MIMRWFAMIIDMRCRPPFGGFLNPALCDLYITDAIVAFSKRFGMTPTPAVLEKSMDLFIQEMTEAGVDKAVVPIRITPGGLATEKSDNLHMDNDDLLKLYELYPDKIIGIAGMNLMNPEIALADIDRYVLNGPCQGVIVEPGFNFQPLLPNDDGIYPIYEKCEKNNIPVLISCGDYTAPSYEFHKPCYIEDVAKTFPKLKISLGHAAWPWTTEIAHVTFKYDNLYISPDLYLMNAPGSQDYIAAANYFIPEKILYGSAYPVAGMKDAIELHKRLISEMYIDDMLGNNAARFFGMTI